MFSDKRYIVYVYVYVYTCKLSSETSCLCPYKESGIPENDTSHFRVPYNLYSVHHLKFFTPGSNFLEKNRFLDPLFI